MQQKDQSLKLAIIVSHPIQYYAPVFKLLAQKTELKVFYTRSPGTGINYDKGFQQEIEWDIPLLDGYIYEFTGSLDIIQCLRLYQPNRLLIYGWAHLTHLRIMHHFKGKIPIAFRGVSILKEKSGLKDFLKTIALKWVYSHIDKVFYVGTRNRAYFKKYGVKEDQLFFAPHAIDNDRFSEKTAIGISAVRKDFGIHYEAVVLLFAGKFDHNKNPLLLLQAFKQLDLPYLHLIFAGSGVLERKLKKESKLQPRVHFLPFQNQRAMPALYQACDVFCLPSKGDSWGLSINEAMAAGRAVITSDEAGSAPDLIKPENGRIFKSNDIEDLKKHLMELTNDGIKLKIAGHYSKNIILNWSFDLQVQQLLRWL